MSQFGASVFVQTDDFFAPAPLCIKSELDSAKKAQEEKEAKRKAKAAAVAIQFEEEEEEGASKGRGHFDQMLLSSDKKTATITLNDCLACSGCVTSAETVLITQQSVSEFLSHAGPDKGGKTVVVTISPQSRVALAEAYGLSQIQVLRKLTTFFQSLGAKAVLDASCGLDIALVEACAEFVARFRRKEESDAAALPVLAGECPGWVCYAEKKQHAALPLLSTVKSPQQIMGSLVKRYLAKKRWGASPGEIYHVAVMPCYDKKLEAAREAHSRGGVREVDCVLTTAEVRDLLIERKVNLEQLEEAQLDEEFVAVFEDGKALLGCLDVGASGGYAECILRFAAKELFGLELSDDTPLEWKQGRNADLKECVLFVDGKPALHFATVYGFRNVGPLMKRLSSCGYHYVEVMACPSGCLNGGGQIRAQGSITAQKQLVRRLDALYRDALQVRRRPPHASSLATRVYRDVIGGPPGSPQAREWLHTYFTPVEPVDLGLATKW